MPTDLVLLVSRWIVESHMFFAALGEVGPTLKDVLNLMALLPYKEVYAMGLIFEGEDEDKLQQLTAASSHSKVASSSKSTYAPWIHYFEEGEGSRSRLVLEALLAYRLS